MVTGLKKIFLGKDSLSVDLESELVKVVQPDSLGYGSFPKRSPKTIRKIKKIKTPETAIPKTGIALVLLLFLGLAGYGTLPSLTHEITESEAQAIREQALQELSVVKPSEATPVVKQQAVEPPVVQEEIIKPVTPLPVFMKSPLPPKVVPITQKTTPLPDVAPVKPVKEKPRPVVVPERPKRVALVTPAKKVVVKKVVVPKTTPVTIVPTKRNEGEMPLGGIGTGGSASQYEDGTAREPKGDSDTRRLADTKIDLPTDKSTPTPPTIIISMKTTNSFEEVRMATREEAEESDDETTGPVIKRRVEPVVPEHLRDKSFEKTVEATFYIHPNGKFTVSCDSSGNKEVDAVVLKALKKWRFEAARDNGEPIECVLDITIRISIM